MNYKSHLLAIVFFIFALGLCVSSSSSAQVDVKDSVPPGFEPVDTSKFTGESYEFETQVNRLMKLIINSLYKSKDIFLRELLSNASDALQKIKTLSLKKKKELGNNTNFNISIVIDKESRTLTITDTGVGMTRAELKANLGTIAKSGTSEFLSAFEKGNTTNMADLIGQFGVGFYSVFLIADSVSVISKSTDDEQYIWESNSENNFVIKKDPRGNTLGRGTQIILYVKDDALEYLDQSKITELVETHSQYIQFPIYLWTTKTVSEEVPIPPEELEKESKEEKESKGEEDPVQDVTEESKEPEKPKTKTIEKKVSEWDLLNKLKPLWTRSSSDVKEEEYHSFYKTFTKDYSDPMAYSHFRAEGDVEFYSLLFIPKNGPDDFLKKVQKGLKNIKLFIRRVFVTDETESLLPSYLSFVKGLVDADDIPINVSRETPQQTAQMKIIGKKLLSKVFEMINKLTEDETKYGEFWKEYGAAIKLGLLEEKKYADKLVKFLRFYSSKSKKLISLDEYIKNMKEGQEQIYYIVGDSVENLQISPLVENLMEKDYEILFMTDIIDDYLANSPNFKKIQDKPTQNIAKSGVKLGKQEEEESKEFEAKFQPLIAALKTTLVDYVKEVKISHQLSKSPCAVIAPDMALSASMEKLMKAQGLSQKDNFAMQFYAKQKYDFEINPKHPIILELLNQVKEGNNNLEDTIVVLFESTAISSGYSVRNPTKFAEKMTKVIRSSLGLKNESPPSTDSSTDEEDPKEEKKEEVIDEHEEL